MAAALASCNGNKIADDITDIATDQANTSVDFTYTTDGLKATFSNTSDSKITSYSWNFGDNKTSTLKNPSHTYTKAGTYTVTLTGTWTYRAHTQRKTVTKQITVAGSSQPTNWTTAYVVGYTIYKVPAMSRFYHFRLYGNDINYNIAVTYSDPDWHWISSSDDLPLYIPFVFPLTLGTKSDLDIYKNFDVLLHNNSVQSTENMIVSLYEIFTLDPNKKAVPEYVVENEKTKVGINMKYE